MIATDGPVATTLPEIRRPDAGHVLIGRRETEGPEQQRAVMDATLDAWEGHPLPGAFLSHTVYAGVDGRTVLDYAQWTSAEAHRAFAEGAGNRRTPAPHLGDDAPEAVRPGAFRLYRSLTRPDTEPAPKPGCIVIVSFDTDGPEIARRFVDTLVDHFGGGRDGNGDGRQDGDGGIASHFHIRNDGSQVINYSEWVSAEAHEEIVRSSLRDDGEVFRIIRSIEGLHPRGFQRFAPYRGLGRPPVAAR